MKFRLTLFSAITVLAILIAACAPSVTQPPTSLPPELVIPSVTPFQPVSPTLEAPTQDPGVAPTSTSAPVAVATSRGPDLHATDPTTVSLASGQYQFVEFFRFT